MNNENIINTVSDLKDHFDNWVCKFSTEKELLKKIIYNLDNTDLKVVFLANRLIVPSHALKNINNTMNVCTNNPNMQKLFMDQFRKIDPRTSGCDDMDTSYLRQGKDIYFFPTENSFLDRRRQFELRFFPDESSMNLLISDEIDNIEKEQELYEQKLKDPIKNDKKEKCILQ